jgi:HNH endonuclease
VATKKTAAIPSMVRKQIFQESNSSCAVCGNSDVAALDIHHIDARKDNGSDAPENLILLCSNCHRRATHGSLSREEVTAAKLAAPQRRQAARTDRRTLANVVRIDGNVHGSIIANNVHLGTKRLPRPKGHPPGSIGADLPKKNYVDYLIRRYHEYRKADGSFGRGERFEDYSYAILHKNVERTFKAKTFYIPVHRFPELVAYLQGCVDRTILGKTNRSRGVPNYEPYDQYVRSQGFGESNP